MFAAETLDNLDYLLGICLELQEKPNPEAAKEIFRTMHSIKGNAQVIGFTAIAEIIHDYEEVLEKSLNHKLQDYKEASELLLATHDILLVWCNNLKANLPNATDVFDNLKDRIQNYPFKPKNQIKKVLIVDDDKDLLNLLKNSIDGLKGPIFTIETQVCYNGFEAISLAIEQDFDLIITDLKMPVLDGLEFIKGLRKIEKNKTSPILFISGYFSTVSTAENKEYMDNVLFIEKPFKIETIINYMSLFFISSGIDTNKNKSARL